MKKIIILLVLTFVFGYKSKCQVDSFALAKAELIKTISHLDTSKITTGMLADRAFHPIPLTQFDGDSDSVVSSAQLGYIHNKINDMFTDGDSLIPFDSIHKLANNLDVQKINSFIIYNFKYNYIKDDALTNNLLDTINGFFEEVAGNTTSPYSEGRIFVATPSFHTMGSDTSVSFYFGGNFFLTNNLADSNKFQIDFGDGSGYRSITLGSTLTANFPSEGVYTGDIKLYDASSGSIFHSPFTINVAFELSELKFSPKVAEIKATIPFNNQYAEALYVYTFGKGNNSECFRKPLIFVDGVDFGPHDRPSDDTKTPCLNGKCGSLGYVDIATGWYNGNINYNQTGLPDQNGRWDEFQLGPTLIEKLHNEGYDIIFLDFKDGATYMQANAMVLVELINYVNAHKCSKEELVVLGASMGGQVARYALSYMETKNMKHCVRSSIYFDSPHKGANIAIGIQLFMDYFAKYNSSKLFDDAEFNLKHKLHRPATFQLLNNSLVTSDYSASSLRSDFMDDLVNNFGSYPKYIRRVAVSNGSGTGRLNAIISESLLAEMNIPLKGKWYQPLALSIKSELRATSKSGYGLYTIFMGDANGFNNKEEVIWHNNVHPGYDNAPGGLNDAIKSLSVFTQISKYLNFNSPKTYYASTCFIPTNSGLGLVTNDLNVSVVNEIGNSNYPDRSKYAFDAYYAPSDRPYEDFSQLHVQMTSANINWLIMELRRSCNQLSELPKSVSYLDVNEVSYSQTCSTYNFGTHFRHILNDIEVNSNGILQVNKDDYMNYKIAYDTWNDRGEKNFYQSSFELYTSDCGSEVEINDGGKFNIGDNNNIPNNNKANVTIREGSNLYLNSGSHLYIYSGSKLIIEKDATLFIENNADIYIEAGGSIEIKGRLYLANNASFKPGGPGLVVFNNANSTFGIAASNSSTSVEFKSTANETKLEISGTITTPSQLGMFKVDGAIVTTNNNSGFNLYSPVYFDNATFTPSATNSSNHWNGIVFNNQGDNIVHIDQSKFYNATTALDFSTDYALTCPSFYRDEFYSNTLAFSIHDAGVTLNNCIFQNNTKALNANWITASSLIQGCTFKDNNLGIDYQGNTNAMLLLKNNNIISSDVNIVSPSTNAYLVTMRCNKFTTTNINIDYASVNLSSTTLHNTTDYGGYNIFKESPLGFYNIKYLNLATGFNDFIMTSNTYLSGTIKNSTSQSNTQINNNYFNRINGGTFPLPNGIPSNICSGKFNLTYINANNNASSVFKLYGNLPTQQNGGCQGGGAGQAPVISKTETDNTNTILYPNPTNDKINIELPETEANTTIQIMDMQGKVLIKGSIASGTTLYTVDVLQLPAGIYMVLLQDGVKTERLRFVKN